MDCSRQGAGEGLVDVPGDYAKAISDYYCLSAFSRPARIQFQQVVAIVRYRKTSLAPGALESLAFESLFPPAGFRGPRSDQIRESQGTPECGAMPPHSG
jgi:hypothetical protein